MRVQVCGGVVIRENSQIPALTLVCEGTGAQEVRRNIFEVLGVVKEVLEVLIAGKIERGHHDELLEFGARLWFLDRPHGPRYCPVLRLISKTQSWLLLQRVRNADCFVDVFQNQFYPTDRIVKK